MGKRRRSKHQEAAKSRQNPAWVDITKENALLETYYQICCGRKLRYCFCRTAVSVENGPFGNKTSPKILRHSKLCQNFS